MAETYQSYIPSIDASSPSTNSYITSAPQFSGVGESYIPSIPSGPSWTMADVSALVQSGAAPSVDAAANMLNQEYYANQGSYNELPYAPVSGGGGATGGGSSGGGFTIAGEGWMSPEEMRAQTNALQSSSVGGSGSGGGGGGGGSAVGRSGSGSTGGTGIAQGGLNLASLGNLPPGSTASQLQTGMYVPSPTISYQAPYTPGGGQQPGGLLQMNSANPQAALDSYKNTPGYQLLNAPGAYQQSPGYQYAMDEAMKQTQGAASARGMLESGAVLKDMQRTASGLAQQDYGNWWNRQNQLYGDYQNRLQGLAGGPTGSADAMTAGANMAQANLQTGSNLGSLFGNQGTTGMGGIINTAAAQAGNMINAGQQQATVNAANQATQLAGATVGTQNKGLF